MPNVIGVKPEFTTEVGDEKEVKETPAEIPQEKETETPSELPTEEKPDDTSTPEEDVVEDTGDAKQVQGLLSEREKLLKEIKELRGQRRNLRETETEQVIMEVSDKLDDLNPEDVKNIDRVLKSKGYITKDESKKIVYENAKNEALGDFLEKYPEYKPENDPDDLNWNAFQRELLSFYKMPENPKLIGQTLEKAHKGIAPPVDNNSETVKKRIATAQKGGGGMQKSSSGKRLSPQLRRAYEDGGWSEEEIKELEN